MSTEIALTTSQLIVQICLFLVAAIAIFGGSLQMVLGQPDTSPRLDNVHRFMAQTITSRAQPDARPAAIDANYNGLALDASEGERIAHAMHARLHPRQARHRGG